MPRIFISYRRSDSGTFTGRIHDRLSASFGAGNVFRDVYDIPAGRDFRTVISKEVGSADVCLVIIGPTWVNITDAQGQPRLTDPKDFVRIEVETALHNPKTLVIPVLVDGAVIPVAEELPSSLKELAYRNAVQVRTDPDFPHDMEVLIRQLRRSKARRRMSFLLLPILLLLLLVPGLFLYSSAQNKGPFTPTLNPTATAPSSTTAPPSATGRPSTTTTRLASTSTPLVEPVGADEVMVLVAQMEPIGTRQRDVTRFIVDDLVQHFDTDLLVTNVRIREYGATIKSDPEAQAIADQTDAVLVIWGQYDDEATTVKVQLGSLKPFPDLALDRATMERILNIRLQLQDEHRETLAFPILSGLAAVYNAANDMMETTRYIVSLDQVDGDKPEIIGSSAATFSYHAGLMFQMDPQITLNELSQAIDLDPNPYYYAYRGTIYQGMGKFDLGRQDIDTARLKAPPGWIMPYYFLGSESLITGNLDSGLAAYSRIIEARPDDWLPYHVRGYLYFLAGEIEQARTDVDKAISLGPDTEWPYMLDTVIALRQGRLKDARTSMKNILSNQSANPIFIQRLMTIVYGEENARLLGNTAAAVGYLAIGQFAVAAQKADEVLLIRPDYADMYLIKGLSYCNMDQYQNADDAYSAGLEVNPAFSMMYFLRAEVRSKLGDVDGATTDLARVAVSDIADTLQPYLDDGYSCKDVTADN